MPTDPQLILHALILQKHLQCSSSCCCVRMTSYGPANVCMLAHTPTHPHTNTPTPTPPYQHTHPHTRTPTHTHTHTHTHTQTHTNTNITHSSSRETSWSIFAIFSRKSTRTSITRCTIITSLTLLGGENGWREEEGDRRMCGEWEVGRRGG